MPLQADPEGVRGEDRQAGPAPGHIVYPAPWAHGKRKQSDWESESRSANLEGQLHERVQPAKGLGLGLGTESAEKQGQQRSQIEL